MGVFGALNAAVSGLTAQSIALENISGNIANSSTVAFKRLDTSFSDFVGGSSGAAASQRSGTVAAHSRTTNHIGGDPLQFNDEDTFISIDGPGYFVVAEKIGDRDGQPIFGGNNLYTRRGDFSFDSAGRLVNESGFFLQGRPIDPITGNISAGVPEIIQVDNTLIPAVATNRITLTGNLPKSPDVNQRPLTYVEPLNGDPNDNPAFPAGSAVGRNSITFADQTRFLESTVGGGVITGYTTSGEPANVQFRWAKTQDAGFAGTFLGAGGIDLTGDPNLSAQELRTVTLTTSGGNTVSYTFTDATTGQAQALEDALSNDGFTVTRTDHGLDISRDDGQAFTIDTTNPSAVFGVGGADFVANPDPDFSTLFPSSITLAAGAPVNSSVTYDFTNANTGQLGDLTAALEGAGYTVTATVDGLDISRADGAPFTVDTTDRSHIAGSGGVDLTPNLGDVGDPNLSSLEGVTVTVTAPTTPPSTVNYLFTNSATGQAQALETALEAQGFTIERTANGLDIRRDDGEAITVTYATAGPGTVAAAATALGIPDNTTSPAVTTVESVVGIADGAVSPTIPDIDDVVGIADGAANAAAQDTWALYYNTDSDPTAASDQIWAKAGDFQFDADGNLTYPSDSLHTITDLTVDGTNLGDITLDFSTGLTQFDTDDPDTRFSQNGFPAGEVVNTAISDSGRLVATYSNGRQRDLYEISVVTFQGENSLSRGDGGVFLETAESGQPIFGNGGTILGQTLEGSNVEIADEFSKLIVTQQAYSANTRIITTADELLQETLNIVR